MIVSVLLVIASSIIPIATGGLCWANYDPVSGKCVALVYRNVSNDTCCSRNGFSFTKRDMTYEEAFRAIVTEGGVSRCVPCSSFKGDVCAGITCGRDQYCEARNLQPRCVCQRNCPDTTISGPVCATNSRDYSDECHLRKARCKRKLNIEVAYVGRCQDSCENVQCLVGRCIEDEYGIPRCINCQPDCRDDEELGPVCGMNNYTYESECHLRLASCATGVAIGLNHQGRCHDSQDCSTFLCMEGRSCVMDTIPLCFDCELRECNYRSFKICGSDNNTYSNICEMKRQICRSREYITQKHIGPCAGGISSNSRQFDGETIFRQYLDFIRHERLSQLAATTNFDSNVLDKVGSPDVEMEEIPTEDPAEEGMGNVIPEKEKVSWEKEEGNHYHHQSPPMKPPYVKTT